MTAPFFSIVTPVYNTPLDVLGESIESVMDQSFEDWELILIDDNSPDPRVRDLLHRYARSDRRIKVIERETNGHIVAASNDGIAVATGEFIALLDHDDLLTPDALERNYQAIQGEDEVDYLYSDEDKYDGTTYYDTFIKPDWSPQRLRSQNYCCHFSVLRASLVREVGGFREGFDGSQDHDLILRVTEKARHIVHIPEILYHWRVIPGSAAGQIDAKPYAFEAGRKAVEEHVRRVGIDAEVVEAGPGMYRLQRSLSPFVRVSVVIPTIGTASLVWGRRRVHVVEAVRSALARTKHENLEFVVVYDPPTPPQVLDELREVAGDKLVLVPFREKFNYSRKTNLGVLASTGQRLVLLNDDVEIRSDNWLEELLAPLDEDDVGLTGARLLYSNGLIQHCCIAMLNGHYTHPYRLYPPTEPGLFGDVMISREVGGVTGACIGVRRDVYLEVGGLPEGLPESFNDVDLSYKVRNAGYRILYVPTSELYHFESISREPLPKQYEIDFIRGRWGEPDRDPFTPVYPGMPEPVRRRLV